MCLKYVEKDGENVMETLYFNLFNRITEAIEAIDACNYGMARDILVKAQQDGEEAYIEAGADDAEEL